MWILPIKLVFISSEIMVYYKEEQAFKCCNELEEDEEQAQVDTLACQETGRGGQRFLHTGYVVRFSIFPRGSFVEDTMLQSQLQ